MEWAYYYGYSATRKNVDTDFSAFNISIEQNGAIKTSLDNKIIWNRRGYLPLIPVHLRSTFWADFLKREQYPVLSSLESINTESYTGSYSKEFLNNKITNLLEASNAGLSIPGTIVTNNRKDLLAFVENGRRYITKCIYQEPNISHKGYHYPGGGTMILDTSSIPETFAPSLVQEYVEKEIELRVFYFRDKFFAMAIFSQQDEETRIDFRNYNRKKPNRTTPFLLPDTLTEKLEVFVANSGHDTGSIDIILTPDGKYVFLEINAMGQYDWVSEGCNYYIDKYIAEKLAQNGNN